MISLSSQCFGILNNFTSRQYNRLQLCKLVKVHIGLVHLYKLLHIVVKIATKYNKSCNDCNLFPPYQCDKNGNYYFIQRACLEYILREEL